MRKWSNMWPGMVWTVRSKVASETPLRADAVIHQLPGPLLPYVAWVRHSQATLSCRQSMAIYGNLSNHSSEKPGKQPDLGTTNKQILVSFKHQDFSSIFTLSQISMRCSCHMPCRLSKHAAPRIHLPLPVDGGCLETMLHGGSLGKFSKVFFET